MKNSDDYIDFTARANKYIKKTVSQPLFESDGADDIFKTLEHELSMISFGDYLRRYIYRKVRFEVPFEQVKFEAYQRIIIDSFEETETPKSFTPNSTKLSAMVKNWLTQRQVKRNVVFLLGFGLSMSVDDVNELLEKGLKEKGINPKDPFEVVCWYCYKNGLNFEKYEQLWNRYRELLKGDGIYGFFDDEQTISIRNKMSVIKDENSLMEYLNWMKLENPKSQSATARAWFNKLYAESRKLVAAYFNTSETVEEIRSSGHNGGRYFTSDDITPGDIEKVIYAAVPLDANGNMIPEKKSLLSEQFGGKRFSRQRVNEILNGRTEITRTDLITLYFFVIAKKMEDDFGEVNEKAVYFTKSVNKILEDCQMWPLYMANPYESFIYLCMKTEDPLETYAQVLEKAYRN